MPGYLVDEGGERTHAVLPLDEYERLTKAAERLESVRGYAMEMISAMGEDGNPEGAEAPVAEAPADDNENSDADNESRAWYQRT